MESWQTLWTWLLGLSVLLFFLVEVVVVVGGARDIGDMLRSLMQQADQKKQQHGQPQKPRPQRLPRFHINDLPRLPGAPAPWADVISASTATRQR